MSEVIASKPVSASPQQIASAGEAQPDLPFATLFLPWQPETRFLGKPLKYGHGGGGSQRRMAMALVRGPKLGRGHRRRDKAEARAEVDEMTPEQLAAAAATTYSAGSHY